MYLTFVGTTIDNKSAAQRLVAAMERGLAWSRSFLGIIRQKGDASLTSPEMFLEYMEKACNLVFQEACKLLKL